MYCKFRIKLPAKLKKLHRWHSKFQSLDQISTTPTALWSFAGAYINSMFLFLPKFLNSYLVIHLARSSLIELDALFL